MAYNQDGIRGVRTTTTTNQSQQDTGNSDFEVTRYQAIKDSESSETGSKRDEP